MDVPREAAVNQPGARMDRRAAERNTFLLLVLTLSVLSALNTFLPQGEAVQALQQAQMPVGRPAMALINAAVVLVVYGGLGLAGLFLARRTGFAGIWDPGVSGRRRFLLPGLAGAGLGLVFIGIDSAFARLSSLGPLPHPPFPTSLVASLSAGIGEETMFRLFFIPFWVWLISAVLLRGRGRRPVFWAVTSASALAFAAGHLPSLLLLTGAGSLGGVPPALLAEGLLINGTLSVAAAVGFRRFGFLAAVGVHFWADVVWHVLWGLTGG